MALAFGEKIISKVYFGGKTVSAIYLGTKKVFPTEEEEAPATGDIRLRIQTTTANQSFPLFYQITTEEGGYISVDWGDGNKETFTGNTYYQPKHTYATAGGYTVKLTGSKFTMIGDIEDPPIAFKDAIREILSLKMPTDSTSVSLRRTFRGCTNLTGNIPEWDDCITRANHTYYWCTGLTGNIPAWGANITETLYTYCWCTGLTGNIPEWGANITDAEGTYNSCMGLTGSIPAWGANITNASYTYQNCMGLTGSIPAWGANIMKAYGTYWSCSGLTGCSDELLQDPMPSRIKVRTYCVSGCVDAIRKHFTPDWGGTKEKEFLPGTGDIRLRIETTTANQSFPLFYQITTEEGGYISVDWGDCKTETLTGKTTYRPEHTYATAGEYIVKLTGSKFTGVYGSFGSSYDNFQTAVLEILSLKMPTDSTSVSLRYAFYWCTNLTGSIPAWDDCITSADSTYMRCSGLTGSIPEWGANITDAGNTYWGCDSLTGNIPEWGANITSAWATYQHCTGLTGSIPEWGAKITDAGNTYLRCSGLTGNIPTWGVNIKDAGSTYDGCTGLTGSIPEWGANITDAYGTYWGCSGLTGSIPKWGANIENAYGTYFNCTGLTGNIPEWGANITIASGTYDFCTGLTGNIPAWGTKIVNADFTYQGCASLTGNIPEWGANIIDAEYTYQNCASLTGNIPEWGANITISEGTYYGCKGLTGCSKELLQDPMPSRITRHGDCVLGCVDAIRQHFTEDWGGTKEELPGTGDIRLRIETTTANQSFPLFYQINTLSDGYVSVDWGDGNAETFTDRMRYSLEHTYAEAGEYIVKLTGSKFTGVTGGNDSAYDNFQTAIREILSLKMPTDSTSVSLKSAFFGCTNLTGNIPEWDDCIVDAGSTYGGCGGLTGNIPEWGANITNARSTYMRCSGLTGSIPEWGANITVASGTYHNCTGLTGEIPAWGANIVRSASTYYNCTGLTDCSDELLWDPMPSRIIDYYECVTGCVNAIRQHFTKVWGGTKAG